MVNDLLYITTPDPICWRKLDPVAPLPFPVKKGGGQTDCRRPANPPNVEPIDEELRLGNMGTLVLAFGIPPPWENNLQMNMKLTR